MAAPEDAVNRVPAGPRRLGPRTRTARLFGMLAAATSRMANRGSGTVIGGRVMLKLDPRAMRRLAAGRRVVLVTGTNGKTTTTHMLSSAMTLCGAVTTNANGSNMPDGLTFALARDPRAPYAVLEVDEMHLGIAARQLRPEAIVLLNLSRDQLDRVGEVRLLAARLRQAVAAQPQAVVVANVDDPMVVSAAVDARRAVWVSAGNGWTGDTAACPCCGDPIVVSGAHWSCACGLHRPDPTWTLDGDSIMPPAGDPIPLRLRLPGRVNLANAAMALAAATELGAPTAEALLLVSALSQVEGRYRQVRVGGRNARFLLAKNPAGWAEMLTMLEHDNRPVVVVINGREADGCDLSWIWDVPFERLRGRPLVASGERARDLSMRLAYADAAHQTVPDPVSAITAAPPGDVEVITNYTAFRDLVARTARTHLEAGDGQRSNGRQAAGHALARRAAGRRAGTRH